MNEISLENWEKTAADHEKKYKQFLQKPDKKQLLKVLPDLHDEAFEKIDCLDCAACCKNYSPRFKGPDIERISKHVGMRETEIIDKCLVMDNDGDYVANTKPCPFLGADNFCSIYDKRPSDCERFPYTDEDVFFKRRAMT